MKSHLCTCGGILNTDESRTYERNMYMSVVSLVLIPAEVLCASSQDSFVDVSEWGNSFSEAIDIHIVCFAASQRGTYDYILKQICQFNILTTMQTI